MVGGAASAVLLLAIGWFLLISPQKAQTSSLQDQTAASELRLSSVQHRLAELRRQNKALPRYRAQLARDRDALPATSGLSDFLRELQAAGDSAGVSVRGVNVGAPSEVTGAATPVYALPITVTAAGDMAPLGRFLDQLQQVQPRAVLIASANADPDEQGGSLAGRSSLTLNLQAFVAPANSR